MEIHREIEIRLLRPALDNDKSEWRFYVLCGIFICSMLLAGSIMIAGSKLTFAIAIIPLVLPLMIAYPAMLQRGIWDSTVLFPAAFAAYNGVLLLRFLSQDVLNHIFYPVRFDPHDFFLAALLSALAAIFIALAWVIWNPGSVIQVPAIDVNGWFCVGIVFYAIGVVFYFVQYAMVGGYMAALATDRLERFEELAEAQSFPYIPFVLTGLVMMMIASRPSRRKRTTTMVLALLWCVVVLAQGDRRLVLQAALSIICAVSFLSIKQSRIRLKYLFLGLVAYGLFSIAGPMRTVIPLIASGRVSFRAAIDSASGELALETIEPENTELGGPFLSLLYNAGNVKHFSWGVSYLDTIGAALPRVLYPGRKPSSPSTDLANAVHKGTGPVTGWGYSPVAEAFLNFGVAGVCLISLMWMVFFIILSRLRSHLWGLVIAAVLSSECVNANRIDFRTVYVESFYSVLAILLAAFTVKLLYSPVKKKVLIMTFGLSR